MAERRRSGPRGLAVAVVAAALLCPPHPAAAADPALAAPGEITFPLPLAIVTDDGSSWRQEQAGWGLEAAAHGDLQARAWWPGIRPPRGQMVVLTFAYRDDLLRPAVVEVQSGLGTARPYSELHRIGGHNDGRWRVARVPVSADFLFRREPSGTVRFRLSAAFGRLQARGFRLVAPLADEEQRYNAETRAWIERVQRRAEIDPRYWRLAETPSIPSDWADRPLIPYRRSWMVPLRPISAPQAGEAGSPLAARGLPDTHEPVQLGIFANGRNLHAVTVTVDPVTDAGGTPVADLRVRVAEYAKVKGQLLPDYLVEPYPQRLWPAYPFDVPAGRSHLVWIDVHAGYPEAAAGVYHTTVHIRGAGIDEVTIPLTVEIGDVRPLTMSEAGLTFGGSIPGLIPEFELGFLRDYNFNMMNLWYSGVRPRLSRRNGALAMDLRELDDWMAAARRQGFGDIVYFLGGDPYRFPRTMHLPRTLAATLLDLDNAGWAALLARNPSRLPPPIAEAVVEWSRQFGAHGRANGWPNVILTPFDEPAKYRHYVSDSGMLFSVKPQFSQQAALLRQGNPDVQIYASIHDADVGLEFLADVDIFCTNVADENPAMADAVNRAGKAFWQYSGVHDRSLPAVTRYVFGFSFASYGSRGAIVWAYNWGNRFDTLDGRNWTLAWNTPFDVIPTPALEGLRKAWDDRRLIETLRQAAAERGVDLAPFWGRLFAEVRAAQPWFDPHGGDSDEQASAAALLDAWHERVLHKLGEIRAR